MMSKMDALILAVPVCHIRDNMTLSEAETVINEHGLFMRRGDLEEDESWRQVIPYVALTRLGHYLRYKRPSNGAETRLTLKRSIGFGGHVDFSDYKGEETTVYGSVLKAAIRELKEELGIDAEEQKFRLLGSILLDSSSVDRVHWGLFYTHAIDGHYKFHPSEEVSELLWIEKADLLEPGKSLEAWSTFALQNYIEVA